METALLLRRLKARIENADCRLTLYKNYRNTKKIAETSFKPFKKEPKLFDSAIGGSLPNIAFVENNEKELLDSFIKTALEKGITDIQILSCTTLAEGKYAQYLNDKGDYVYNNKTYDLLLVASLRG